MPTTTMGSYPTSTMMPTMGSYPGRTMMPSTYPTSTMMPSMGTSYPTSTMMPSYGTTYPGSTGYGVPTSMNPTINNLPGGYLRAS